MVVTIHNIEKFIKTNPHFSGILCPNGELHTCAYMGHNNLCKELYKRGLVSHSDWVTCDDIFHFSSGQLNGTLAFRLKNFEDWDEDLFPNIPDEQIEMLKRMPQITMYSSTFRDPNVGVMVLRYHIAKVGKGGKYGTLSFIKSLWAAIKTPNLDVEGIIRSSPKRSIPGALFSKVGNIDEVGNELEQVWNNLPTKLTDNNKLHYFSQEFIEGVNGVFHYRKGKFTYQASNEQGSVVNGKTKSVKVDSFTRRYLKEIGRVFSVYFNKSVQCEFVVPTGEIEPVIVQLRLLDHEFSTLEKTVIPDDALFTGQSFCSVIPYGKWYNTEIISKEDILVVNSDCEDTTRLVGKKLLIVKKNIEFSHILALSKTLRIPSMYNITDKKFNLDAYSAGTKFEFDTTCEVGYLRLV